MCKKSSFLKHHIAHYEDDDRIASKSTCGVECRTWSVDIVKQHRNCQERAGKKMMWRLVEGVDGQIP